MRREDTTVIQAEVRDEVPMESKTYRNDSGAPFTPETVILTLYRSAPEKGWTSAVEVKVGGSGFLKSGKPSQQRLGVIYSSKGGLLYSRDLPLADMPEWLAAWVQNAPDELKGDA
jgi:hypothetical protein